MERISSIYYKIVQLFLMYVKRCLSQNAHFPKHRSFRDLFRQEYNNW